MGRNRAIFVVSGKLDTYGVSIAEEAGEGNAARKPTDAFRSTLEPKKFDRVGCVCYNYGLSGFFNNQELRQMQSSLLVHSGIVLDDRQQRNFPTLARGVCPAEPSGRCPTKP